MVTMVVEVVQQEHLLPPKLVGVRRVMHNVIAVLC